MSAGLLSAAATEAALISYRDLKQQKIMPLPSDFAAVIIFYGVLGMLPDSANTFKAAVGWGIVVATLLNLWNPSSPTKLGTTTTTTTTTTGATK